MISAYNSLQTEWEREREQSSSGREAAQVSVSEWESGSGSERESLINWAQYIRNCLTDVLRLRLCHHARTHKLVFSSNFTRNVRLLMGLCLCFFFFFSTGLFGFFRWATEIVTASTAGRRWPDRQVGEATTSLLANWAPRATRRMNNSYKFIQDSRSHTRSRSRSHSPRLPAVLAAERWGRSATSITTTTTTVALVAACSDCDSARAAEHGGRWWGSQLIAVIKVPIDIAFDIVWTADLLALTQHWFRFLGNLGEWLKHKLHLNSTKAVQF